MSRNIGPSCRQCRREGVKLFLKGNRCLSQKCPMSENGKKKFPPGPISKRRKKTTDYSQQLREKQKVKRIYNLLEKQFRKYYKEADRQIGITGDNLVKILESRLDNIIYRMNFTASRNQARLLISHGHVSVRRVTIASYLVKPGDTVEIKDKSKRLNMVLESLKNQKSGTMTWLDVNIDKVQGKVIGLPEPQDVDVPMDMRHIVELYSK